MANVNNVMITAWHVKLLINISDLYNLTKGSAPNLANKCTSCFNDYVLSDTGKCVKCNKNCLTCDPSNKDTCLTCATGKALNVDDNTCNKCSKACKTCSLPDDNTSCIVCSEGYKFDSNSVC